MNNARVTVAKEIAEAITKMRAEGLSNFSIMRQAHGAEVSKTYLTVKRWAFEDGGGSSDLLMQALVNGYTIEKSPEDKVREYYANLSRVCDKFAVKDTLDILGIKIEGVSA